MSVESKAVNTLRMAKEASFNKTQLCKLATETYTMTQIISSRALPIGNGEWEKEARKIRWASDSRIVKVANFVASYTSRSSFSQFLLIGMAASEIRMHNKEVQKLLDWFQVHERRRPETTPNHDPRAADVPPPEVPRPSQSTNSQQTGQPSMKNMVIIHKQTVYIDSGNKNTATVDGLRNDTSASSHQGRAIYNYIN
ncbi:hypothetical protein PLEOSDRAFT_172328 [Pleurotus ostreatus PC15]|uniref:Uncharacterized protein n=1 Tax=Pleurotus ostreatus (strain PC15) TaxID=1137138 RepID=A0A067P3G3_PLEO1|nr:hypothetical protein PLEOSDRAFT_172328 [Pleurotus ostreatus PC15]